MSALTEHPWTRRAATALLLVSIGVIVGSYAPARGARTSLERRPAASPPRQHPAPDAPARLAPRRAPEPQPAVPPAPGYESVLAGSPRPDFGGEYAVLRGARTAGDPVPQASAPPPATIASAPSVQVEVDNPSRARDSAASAPREPEPFRPSPAQGIPRGIALGYPLLAVARPGGRVALHEIGLQNGLTPAAIEGEWAVIGQCGQSLRVEFALPSHRAGELRAIGRTGASGAWRIEPVVARQACAAAGERYLRPHPPTAQERETFGAAGTGSGFAPNDLAQVADAHVSTLLLFRSAAGGAAVMVAARGPASPAVVWRYTLAPGDGDLFLLGVYRVGAGTEAWILVGPPGSPRALLTASSHDGRSWLAGGPFSLQDP